MCKSKGKCVRKKKTSKSVGNILKKCCESYKYWGWLVKACIRRQDIRELLCARLKE